ncbi:hypothetical protein D3C87_1648070 [compost metagenome]
MQSSVLPRKKIQLPGVGASVQMKDRRGGRNLLHTGNHRLQQLSCPSVAQARIEIEIERRIRLHAGLAREHLALRQILFGQSLVIDIILSVSA